MNDNEVPEDEKHPAGESAESAHTETDGAGEPVAATVPAEEAESLSERLTQQVASQWALIREERRSQPEPITRGVTNFQRAQVPYGIDLAAAWAWRFIVIAIAGLAILWTLRFFAVITLPIVVALLITALAQPVVTSLARRRVPRGLSAAGVVVGGIAFVGALLTFAGQQVASGASDLADQVARGLEDIREWVKDGPLNASDSQIDNYLQQIQNAVSERARDEQFVGQVTELGTTVTHVLAGFFIVLFATFFFLSQGERIWSWGVRLAPAAARTRVDTSGRVAWTSLTQFVRATVIVALVDAVGIAIVAAILGVPFVLAIAVLVFLGAFVPMIGATIAGGVAVLVALVDQGPITALLMLGGVILVQQIEGHILQPFLLGRWVALHPLGVITAIGAGVLVAGIAGALIAVPLVAALNAVVLHLASGDVPEDVEEPVPDEGEPAT